MLDLPSGQFFLTTAVLATEKMKQQAHLRVNDAKLSDPPNTRLLVYPEVIYTLLFHFWAAAPTGDEVL